MASVKTPFLRTAYNYDTNQASIDSGLACPRDESKTQQHFKEECDINTIVERFHITGELPENVRMPTYADFTDVFDFHTAMNAIAKANESFDQMPANIRARFQNDPAQFVDFCSKEENREEAIKLGLVPPKPEPNTPPPGVIAKTATSDPGQSSGNPNPPDTPLSKKGGKSDTKS